jgi:hypothetical protein
MIDKVLFIPVHLRTPDIAPFKKLLPAGPSPQRAAQYFTTELAGFPRIFMFFGNAVELQS